MRLFSARLDIENSMFVDMNLYQVQATIIENTGMYFADEVKVGDIVYASGIMYGADIYRYQVSKINSTIGSKIDVELTWDMPFSDMEPMDPMGLEAIIGARHIGANTANIVDYTINAANEKLIADARNYQQILTNTSILNTNSDKTFEFVQDVASTEWVINHNMKKYPAVSIVDETGNLVICNIHYNNINTTTISFNIPFAGKAFLN